MLSTADRPTGRPAAERAGARRMPSHVRVGEALDPHVQPQRPGAGYRFELVPSDEILVEQLAAVGQPQPCLGNLFRWLAVVVDIHVQVASVERAANEWDVDTRHNMMITGRA
jgi:hypothetical protein